MKHSDETKARISAGIKRARAEGRALGRPFAKGDDERRLRDRHPAGCMCATHGGRKPLTASQRQAGLRNISKDRQAVGRLGAANRLALEAAASEALKRDGYEVFKLPVVCDRVAVKDDKVFFVEFKRRGQQLRDGQRRIQELVPEMYLVRFYGE